MPRSSTWRKVGAGALALAALLARGAEGVHWTAIGQNSPPTARYYHASAFDGGKLYVFGGLTLDNAYTPQNDLWVLSGVNNWQQVKPAGGVPPARAYATLTPIGNGQLLLFGGKSEPPNEVYYNDTWVYTEASNAWAQQRSAVAPDERFFHTAVPVGNAVWVFGGATRSIEIVVNDVWATSTTSIGWTQVTKNGTDGPSGRQGHAAVPYNNGMVVVGGRDGTDKGGFADAWFFNGKAWTRLAADGLPPRSAHAAVLLPPSKVYVFGGIFIDPQPPFPDRYHNDVWALDLTTNAWALLQNDSQAADPSRPWQRQGHSGNRLDQTMIIFGGYGNFQGLQNDAWLMSPLN